MRQSEFRREADRQLHVAYNRRVVIDHRNIFVLIHYDAGFVLTAEELPDTMRRMATAYQLS